MFIIYATPLMRERPKIFKGFLSGSDTGSEATNYWAECNKPMLKLPVTNFFTRRDFL